MKVRIFALYITTIMEDLKVEFNRLRVYPDNVT